MYWTNTVVSYKREWGDRLCLQIPSHYACTGFDSWLKHVSLSFSLQLICMLISLYALCTLDRGDMHNLSHQRPEVRTTPPNEPPAKPMLDINSMCRSYHLFCPQVTAYRGKDHSYSITCAVFGMPQILSRICIGGWLTSFTNDVRSYTFPCITTQQEDLWLCLWISFQLILLPALFISSYYTHFWI